MADIDRIADRPRAYLEGTGLMQLTSGLVFFTLGVFALVESKLMASPEYRDYGLVVQYAGLCCTGAVLWGISAIGRRMVFPRGGYVQLSHPNRRWRVAVGAVVVSAGLTLIVSRWPEARLYLDSRLLAPSFAVVFAAICLASFLKERRVGTMGLGLYLLFLAPVLWWIPGGSYERMSAFSAAVGLPLAVTGAWRLRRFLKAHPLGAATPNE